MNDIVLEIYKAVTLERYGLYQASLRKRDPQLIYCSVTGFGQTGPRRDQPAYDFLIQARGGLMRVMLDNPLSKIPTLGWKTGPRCSIRW